MAAIDRHLRPELTASPTAGALEFNAHNIEMQNTLRPHDLSVSQLSFFELSQTVWRWKTWIIPVVLGATLAGAIAAFVLPKQYEATVVVSPVSSSNNSSLSGLGSTPGQLSGLASLAGFVQGADSNKAESLAVLESEALTEKYITDENLMTILYAKDWDSSRRSWRDGKAPTLWQANQLFKKKIRHIGVDSKSGLVRLTIQWTDARLAADWANGLVKLTNKFRREKAIDQSEKNIAYLTSEAAKTDVLGVKQVIYSILQSEISKVMLARGSDEFALKVMDPASPPEKPSSPSPLLWTVAAFFASLGLIIAAAFVFLAFRIESIPATN